MTHPLEISLSVALFLLPGEALSGWVNTLNPAGDWPQHRQDGGWKSSSAKIVHRKAKLVQHRRPRPV
jgi:hypothetical protein